jgi:hypothetical protein
MKILKQFTNWSNKIGKESKKKETTLLSNYTPSKDVYQQIRDIQNEAKKKYERNSDRIKSMSTYPSTDPSSSSVTSGNPLWGSGKSSSSSYPPGTIITGSSYINSPITASNLSSSAITIDGSINGSMRVDVPLIVSGRDVMKELDEMRDVLLLLRRDVDMEAKYPRLKELKDEYETALAKYKTFDTLKESK